MGLINVGGKKYKVTENMGFNHSVGMKCKMVDDEGKERMIVNYAPKCWRFWTFQDRVGR